MVRTFSEALTRFSALTSPQGLYANTPTSEMGPRSYQLKTIAPTLTLVLNHTRPVHSISEGVLQKMKVALALACLVLASSSHGGFPSGVTWRALPQYQPWTSKVYLKGDLRDPSKINMDTNEFLGTGVNQWHKFSIRNGEVFLNNPFPIDCYAYVSQDHERLDARTGSVGSRKANRLPWSLDGGNSLHSMGKLKEVLGDKTEIHVEYRVPVRSKKFKKAKKEPNNETSTQERRVETRPHAADKPTLQSNSKSPLQPGKQLIIDNENSHHSLKSLTAVLKNLPGYRIDKQLILRKFKPKLVRSSSRVPPMGEARVFKEGKILSNDLQLKGRISPAKPSHKKQEEIAGASGDEKILLFKPRQAGYPEADLHQKGGFDQASKKLGYSSELEANKVGDASKYEGDPYVSRDPNWVQATKREDIEAQKTNAGDHIESNSSMSSSKTILDGSHQAPTSSKLEVLKQAFNRLAEPLYLATKWWQDVPEHASETEMRPPGSMQWWDYFTGSNKKVFDHRLHSDAESAHQD